MEILRIDIRNLNYLLIYFCVNLCINCLLFIYFLNMYYSFFLNIFKLYFLCHLFLFLFLVLVVSAVPLRGQTVSQLIEIEPKQHWTFESDADNRQ